MSGWEFVTQANVVGNSSYCGSYKLSNKTIILKLIKYVSYYEIRDSNLNASTSLNKLLLTTLTQIIIYKLKL